MPMDINWNADEINLKDYDLPKPQQLLLLLLPDSPICPILVKLFLQVSSLIVIPPAFFEHMPMLQVLDLSNTNILSLPTSIASLSLLQEFFLRDCFALIEIPAQVGMLSKLKLFDIKGTELMFIPKEMRKLVDLEVLRVSLSQYANVYVETKSDIEKVIPKNMISELKKLKELCISVPPEAEWWEEEVKDIQNELCELENLDTLRWYLPTDEALQQFLRLEGNKGLIYENLSNLMLTIGQHAQLTSCLPSGLEKKFEEFRNCLKWKNGEGNMNDVSKIMESAEALFLSCHWTIEKLSTLDVTNLKYCLLSECNEMESLVEVDGLPEDIETRIKNGEKVGLELLQYCSIHHMEKLQSIWKGPIGKDSLSKLTILALHSCPQLTSIFTVDIAQNLSCLTELTVVDCPKIRSLITTESHNIKHSLIFPSLVRIFLLDLPELVNMFNGLVMLKKLSTLLIYGCSKLQNLPILDLPHIKKIEAEVEWWNGLDWDKFAWENIFVPLKRRRDLVEQLFEATNSLQHFHDILSHDPTLVTEIPAIQDLPGESPMSWNSQIHYPFSYTHKTSNNDASVESWNLGSTEADVARMRKKWGSTQKNILVSNSSSGVQSRKDMTKWFKQLLKFGRKGRGSDNSADWISATTSEGDDDTEDGRDVSNRSSDELRKSRMGFLHEGGFNEANFNTDQIHTLQTSIPTPPANFRLREDHLSGSSIKECALWNQESSAYNFSFLQWLHFHLEHS
ncbi:hypothetical protein E3N88_28136 [Mikania micrantha]|uniref:Uncharacterized protein n=1 Tax=Mikania micrantha TaxID=192012 RepID=A0A5N6N1I0_9ASTR|nr:hypothetical protein E3N88_28136 [Mikania micrantha]